MEVVVAYFKALVQNLPGGAEENCKKKKNFVRMTDFQTKIQTGDYGIRSCPLSSR
jgi:hypothetical protein